MIKKVNKNKRKERISINPANSFKNGEDFYPASASKLVNIRLKNGALSLRDGICQGFSLGEDIVFAQSVVCNGERIGFVSDGNGVYAVREHTENSDPEEAVFGGGVTAANSFIFSTGRNIYLCKEGEFFIYDGYEFVEASFAHPVCELKTDTLDENDILPYTNLLTGKFFAKVTFKEETQSVFIATGVNTLIYARLDGVDILSDIDYSDDHTLLFDTPISAGSVLEICFEPFGIQTGFEGELCGGALSNSGDACLWSNMYCFPIRSESGELFLSQPIYRSALKNIRAAFFCSGLLCIAVGDSVGFVNKDGVFCETEAEGIRNGICVCTGGGGAFLDTGRSIEHFTLSSNGSSYDVNCSSTEQSFGYRNPLAPVSMTYLPLDGCLYEISTYGGSTSTKKLFCFDPKEAVWSEIEGITSPSYCFALDDSVCICSGGSVYFIVPGEIADTYSDGMCLIEGRYESGSCDFFGEADRKRLLEAGASISGGVDSFTLTVNADSGRNDSFSYNGIYYSPNVAFPHSRMNVGAFSHASIRASLKGRAGASIHGIYIDIKSCD